MPLSNHRVCAIIVTFKPNLKHFEALVQAINQQVTQTVVVDNTADPNFQSLLAKKFADSNIQFIYNQENVGLAAAHNKGITWAMANKSYDYVLLLDQDSLPAENMVDELLKASIELQSSGQKIAAVGPTCVDLRNQKIAPFVSFKNAKIIRNYCDKEKDTKLFFADFLIASGSLIATSVLETIGLMVEDFFIDNVDLEWGFRAKHLGYQSVGICAAILYHRLGDDVVNVLGRDIHTHSPLRHYYIFRNRILLYKRAYVPLSWKISDSWRLLPKLLQHLLLTPPRFKHAGMMLLGVWHGVTGRAGKYQGS